MVCARTRAVLTIAALCAEGSSPAEAPITADGFDQASAAASGADLNKLRAQIEHTAAHIPPHEHDNSLWARLLGAVSGQPAAIDVFVDVPHARACVLQMWPTVLWTALMVPLAPDSRPPIQRQLHRSSRGTRRGLSLKLSMCLVIAQM